MNSLPKGQQPKCQHKFGCRSNQEAFHHVHEGRIILTNPHPLYHGILLAPMTGPTK
jgi:hypothetical protein